MEAEKPLISVIVPVYNVERYLDQCVESIVNQTYENLEIILIDDGSPDACPQMCDDWAKKDTRIRVIHKGNGGLSSARNAGLEIAKGEYIGFVDSDDWIAEDMYERLWNLLIQSKADIATCGIKREKKFTRIEGESERSAIKVYSRDEYAKLYFKVKSKRTVHYAVNKLYKAEIGEKMIFPENLIDEDVEGFARALASVEHIVETEEIGYFYRENRESISAKWFTARQMDLLTVWGNVISLCKSERPEWTELAIANYERAHFGLLCRMCMNEPDEDSLYENEKVYLLQFVKNHYWQMLKGPMPFDRKIILTFMCMNYPFTRKAIHCIAKSKGE